jgi:hypothetical protein
MLKSMARSHNYTKTLTNTTCLTDGILTFPKLYFYASLSTLNDEWLMNAKLLVNKSSNQAMLGQMTLMTYHDYLHDHQLESSWHIHDAQVNGKITQLYKNID